jgi:hypothetical protein
MLINRRTALFTILAVIGSLLLASSASASPALSVAEAKAVTAKTAQKVRRQLAEDGARRAKVPGCWRNNSRQVSCFFSIYGFDDQDDFHWQCMLRTVVKLRTHPSRRHGRYRVTYGHAICG